MNKYKNLCSLSKIYLAFLLYLIKIVLVILQTYLELRISVIALYII